MYVNNNQRCLSNAFAGVCLCALASLVLFAVLVRFYSEMILGIPFCLTLRHEDDVNAVMEGCDRL